MNTTTTSSNSYFTCPSSFTNSEFAVQRLNNDGAGCIEKGQYLEAIDTLVTALKIWETVEKDYNKTKTSSSTFASSACFHDHENSHNSNTIDECILQSGRRKRAAARLDSPLAMDCDDDDDDDYDYDEYYEASTTAPNTKNNQRFVTTDCNPPGREYADEQHYYISSSSNPHSSVSSQQQTHRHLQEQEERFIYNQSISTNHPHCSASGNTLSLILILNLAIAHQLHGLAVMKKNMEWYDQDHYVSSEKRKKQRKRYFQKALQLYELAHQLQLDKRYLHSPYVTMIIANNVGEIHLAVQNTVKHKICQTHLLSTMMYVVTSGITCYNERPSSSRSVEQQSNSMKECYWDGFLRNASSLILQQSCAGAA